MSQADQQAASDPPKPRVGEADKRWVEGMRYADRDRRRQLRHEVNDPVKNAMTYQYLMEMVLQIHGRFNKDGYASDEAEARLANTLAGRKFDPSCLRNV